ncbi:Putative peptidoglycan binding domain-containing protein [Desulfonatronum thiosulfatophilum]|uniref:Putative peptidoglycan binding domain-containing protein n=2 Tax=Desulfonatronum thiosulfatophilum TaxID=617002 RepID=A0A1G6E1V4_9BACT|nr:Putative peptidoglycan binding domain-containing protein [Desulfonatronum thiosulfatophilum]
MRRASCLCCIMLLLPLTVFSVSGCATFQTSTPGADTIAIDAAEEASITDVNHELELSDIKGDPGVGNGGRPSLKGASHPAHRTIDPSLSSSGMTTKQAQMRLLYLGYHEVGIADGIMGAKTREALRNFQQDRGIPVTGKIDPATREELMKK